MKLVLGTCVEKKGFSIFTFVKSMYVKQDFRFLFHSYVIIFLKIHKLFLVVPQKSEISLTFSSRLLFAMIFFWLMTTNHNRRKCDGKIAHFWKKKSFYWRQTLLAGGLIGHFTTKKAFNFISAKLSMHRWFILLIGFTKFCNFNRGAFVNRNSDKRFHTSTKD